MCFQLAIGSCHFAAAMETPSSAGCSCGGSCAAQGRGSPAAGWGGGVPPKMGLAGRAGVARRHAGGGLGGRAGKVTPCLFLSCNWSVGGQVDYFLLSFNLSFCLR